MLRRCSTQGVRRAVAVAVTTAVVAAAVGLPIAEVRAASGLTINGDAPAINTPAVTLVFQPEGSGATRLRVSNELVLVDGVLAAAERPWAPSLAWTLDASGPDGERTVYAQWAHDDGQWSPVVSDSIYLDRLAPSGSVIINGGDQYMGDPWAWIGSGGHAYVHDVGTLTLDVQDAGPDLPPAAWALSANGTTWKEQPVPDSGYGPYEYPYDVDQIGGRFDEGPETVWVRWRDAAGNWSTPVTDAITIRFHYAGKVIVDDGIGYTDSYTVAVKVPVDVIPDDGVRYVYLASELPECDDPPKGAGCQLKRLPWTPGMVVSWDMTDPAYRGSTREWGRRVIGWVESTTGRTARLEIVPMNFNIDTQPAVTGPPRPTVTYNSTVTTASGSNVTADIRWSSSGTGSPVAANQLQQSTNASAWGYVPLSSPLSTSAARVLTPGATYRFRSRNQDKAGNWGTWTYGAVFGVSPMQQTSTAVRYTGTWTTWARTDAWGGSVRYTRAKGATATMTFTGRGIALVGPRSGNGGEMDVYIDGKLVNTVYQRSNVLQPRRVLYTFSWTTSGTHVIKIVKKYDNRDYPIYLDGFLVLK